MRPPEKSLDDPTSALNYHILGGLTFRPVDQCHLDARLPVIRFRNGLGHVVTNLRKRLGIVSIDLRTMRKSEHHVPPGKRLQPIKTLKLWPFVLNNHILHLHPFASTQAGAPLFWRGSGIMQSSLLYATVLRT